MKTNIPAQLTSMSIILPAIAFMTVSTATLAQECGAAPTPPDTPDGLEATEDQLIAAVGEFKACKW